MYTGLSAHLQYLVQLNKVRWQGCREDWGGPGQTQKVGPHKMDYVRGVWGHTPRKFCDFTRALKCVLGAPFVHAHSTYILASCLLRLPNVR